MDTNKILVELRAERNRIDQAIAALEALNSTGGPKTAVTRRRAGMSGAARRKLSRLLKQRWAQGKMQRAKAKPTQATKRARRMSKAARNRIAAAQRARWARVKSEQAKKTAA